MLIIVVGSIAVGWALAILTITWRDRVNERRQNLEVADRVEYHPIGPVYHARREEARRALEINDEDDRWSCKVQPIRNEEKRV